MTKKADISPQSAYTAPSIYPDPYKEKHAGRKSWPISRQYRPRQVGVNRVELPPGTWSTQRHWHTVNDEVVVVISGELVVVTDEGEETLGPGDCIAFKAGVPNAHHLQNRGVVPAIYYDIGGRDAWDLSNFPDIGLQAHTMMKVEFRPLEKK